MDAYLDGIIRFPEQLGRAGLSSVRLAKLRGAKPDGVVVAGMGGSGLAGEIIRALHGELKIRVPVVLWKDYGLPRFAEHGFRRPLVVFVSFSGGTEETISGLAELKRNPGGIAVVATGGELARLAERRGLPLVTFPAAGLQPRQATGRMFYGLTEILRAARIITSSPPSFHKLRSEQFRASGEKIARALRNRLAVIYTDEANRHLGYFWKIRLNETAKTQAFTHSLPEMNHNEIVSYEKPVARTVALFIAGDHRDRMRKRIGITRGLLKRHGVETIAVPLAGRSRLEQAWNSLMLADWVSYSLARLRKVDPARVQMVERLKQEMKKG